MVGFEFDVFAVWRVILEGFAIYDKMNRCEKVCGSVLTVAL